MTSNGSTITSPSRTSENAAPISVACLSCRTRHVKCDGQVPACGRCAETATSCTYAGSRRGYQGRKRKAESADSADNRAPPPKTAEAASRPAPTVNSLFNITAPGIVPAVGSLGTPADVITLPIDAQAHTEETISIPQAGDSEQNLGNYIGVYYRNIHPAHPIVLPQRLYQQDRNVLPRYLTNVMAFMACHLTSDDPENLREDAELVLRQSVPEDGFKVQALLLLTLASYARFERDRGNTALSEATALAQRIGMDLNAFSHGQNLVYQESWRRTYWELYTISSLISLIGGINIRMRCPEDLLLPGHCEDYERIRTYQSSDLRTMRSRVPLEDSFRWSSFAYKVEAARILNTVFESESPDGSLRDAQVHSLDASITGFLLALPEDKRTPITEDDIVDEVLSCALMIVNVAGVCLHFPRSSLAGQTSFKTVCGNDRRDKIDSQDERFHRGMALKHANGLSRLISSRDSLRTLTPCFSCAIAFGATVHLAAVLTHHRSEDQNKEHIQLELTALNTVGSIWPIGRVVKAQVAQYAREVLSRPQILQSTTASFQPTGTLSLSNEPWFDDLTNQYIDVPSDGFLFNLKNPLGWLDE